MFPKHLFLQQIITSWTKIKRNTENELIGKEIIWHNNKIKIDNKSIFYQSWFERGIQHIEHLYDYRKKEFYNFKDFCELYNIHQSQFLKYHQLLARITTIWKDKLKLESINAQNETTLFDNFIKRNKQTVFCIDTNY